MPLPWRPSFCYSVSVHKQANWVEIKAREKFNHRHMVDIPRIKFFAQHRYRANWTFVDGHYLKKDARGPLQCGCGRFFAGIDFQTLNG